MTDQALVDRLAQRLWDEGHVVTVLLYELTLTRLLLAADERRFVADARREVAQIGRLRDGSLDTRARNAFCDDGAAGIRADLLRAVEELTSATRRTEALLATLRRELSELGDLDIAQGSLEPQVQQVAYEATLQALGRALPPSLVAFLR
jgi:hypothetical protein